MSVEEDKETMDYQEALDCARGLIHAHPRIVFMMCGLAGSGQSHAPNSPRQIDH